MKPIIKWTLYQRRTSTIWWSIAAFFLIFINMIFYPSFKGQAAELQKGFENIPDSISQFIGGTDFFSAVGFLNSQVFFLMMPLLLGVLTIGLGSSLIAREEQDKTLEALLARPISRTKLLFAKALAGCTIITIVSFVAVTTIVVTAAIVNLDVPSTYIVLASFACWLQVISFGSVAFALSATGKARGASIGFATFVALGGYVINSLTGSVDWLQYPAKLFPFHYYDSEAILRGSFSPRNTLVLGGIIAAAGIISWLSFRRRDIS